MWTLMQYRRVVRGSAWYDLIVSAVLATPWSFAALHGVLMSMTQLFDLPGELPPFAPAHVLMANLLGSIVCVWSVLRIRDPQPLYGRYDAAGRFLFAAWMLYALLHGANAVLWVFLFLEVVWGVMQALPIRGEGACSRRRTQHSS